MELRTDLSERKFHDQAQPARQGPGRGPNAHRRARPPPRTSTVVTPAVVTPAVVTPAAVTPAAAEAAARGYSRFPVTGVDGTMIGYAHIKDLLETDAVRDCSRSVATGFAH